MNFDTSPGVSRDSEWSQFPYFSLTTLTTLGYGDIRPVTTVARIWANLEAIAGLLYLTILVARLVSLYRNQPAVAVAGPLPFHLPAISGWSSIEGCGTNRQDRRR